MVFFRVFVSHHPCSRPASLPLRNLSVRRLPRPGRGVPPRSLLTFNFGLLTSSKPFIIRTSKTPLPQPLYNPHLRAPLGSAGNKGLITPLESALTRNSPVSLLESALAESGGWGFRVSRSALWIPVKSHGLPPPEMPEL